jgi:hypothetical protein
VDAVILPATIDDNNRRAQPRDPVMASVEQLAQAYGYPVILLGTLVEGP